MLAAMPTEPGPMQKPDCFSRIFSLRSGAGVTSLWLPLFDVGRAAATNINCNTFRVAARSVEFRDNEGGDLLGLVQLASANMRIALSANTISQLIEMSARSPVSMIPVPNSAPKLSRSGAPCRQLTP